MIAKTLKKHFYVTFISQSKLRRYYYYYYYYYYTCLTASLDLNEARDYWVLACRGISWTMCKQSS